jgi:tetratricopeptide (TPR) repeat protein
MAHSKLNRHDLAIADFTQSLKLDPNNINALFARAASFNAIGSLSRAIEDYNAAFLKDQVR